MSVYRPREAPTEARLAGSASYDGTAPERAGGGSVRPMLEAAAGDRIISRLPWRATSEIRSPDRTTTNQRLRHAYVHPESK